MLMEILIFFEGHQYIQATGKFATVNIDQFWNHVYGKMMINWILMLMRNNQSPNGNATQYQCNKHQENQTDRFWENSWRNSELFGNLKRSETWVLVVQTDRFWENSWRNSGLFNDFTYCDEWANCETWHLPLLQHFQTYTYLW